MDRVLTDQEINDLLSEEKPLPENWETRLRPRPKQGIQHEERQLEVESAEGKKFRFIARRNRQNALDFSIILVYEDEEGRDYRLTRYNGKHPSRHTNKYEKRQGLPNESFDPAFHVHLATERYQLSGYAIDGYAETTDAYWDYSSAQDAFLEACNFKMPELTQRRLV